MSARLFIRKLGGQEDCAERDGKDKGDGKRGIGAELHKPAAAKLFHEHQHRGNNDDPQSYGADTVNGKLPQSTGLPSMGGRSHTRKLPLHPAADKRDKAGRAYKVIKLLVYPAGNIQHQKDREEGGGKQPQHMGSICPAVNQNSS